MLTACRHDTIKYEKTNLSHPQAHKSAGTTNMLQQKGALQIELEFAAGTNLLAVEYMPVFDSNKTFYTHHSFSETLLSMIDPEVLEKYEGSYTTDELREGNDAPPTYKLKSSWLTGSDAPSVGIHIERNPATGNYEVSGGEIFLPGSGVGMSFDDDRESGESKTFLNWKREF
jgi:hypothetical protein